MDSCTTVPYPSCAPLLKGLAYHGLVMERTRPPLASLRRRALAYVVDAAVLGAVAGALAGESTQSGDRSGLRTVALAGALGSIYHVLLEGTTGKTLGKHVLGTTVVREDGSPCTVRAAGIRTALRAIDWLPVSYLVGTISIVASDQNQRVGDRAARTVVVRSDAPDRAASVDRSFDGRLNWGED